MKKSSAKIEALKNEGMRLVKLGDPDKAERVFLRAHALNGRDHDTLLALGIVSGMLGKYTASERYLGDAVKLAPQSAAAYYNLGIAQKSQHKLAEALCSYQKAIDLQPDVAAFHNNLGSTYLEMRDFDHAVDAFNSALKLSPDSAEYHYNLGKSLKARGLRSDAMEAYRHAARLRPDFTAAWIDLGNAYLSLGNLEAADDCFLKILQSSPDNLDAIAGRANVLTRTRKYQQAFQLLDPYLGKGGNIVPVATAFAGIARHLNKVKDAIEVLERQLDQPDDLSKDNRAQIHFRLGHFYDQAGQYDAAFDHFHSGNELRKPTVRPESYKIHVDSIIETFSSDFLCRAERSGNTSELPVFIVGMPRSGTTLIEQIIASHAHAYGAGELDTLPTLLASIRSSVGTDTLYPDGVQKLEKQHLDSISEKYIEHLLSMAPDAQRITDKMPGNFLNIGFIDLLFPNAHVIHCRRNPLDTCLSCYFQDFEGHHPYVTDLESLGDFYSQYQRLMQHWMKVTRLKVLEVDYEDLVKNFEQACRNITGFCELEWDASCLDFHRHERVVLTASLDQVNRPLYASSVERWRNYEKHLGPLQSRLANLLDGND